MFLKRVPKYHAFSTINHLSDNVSDVSKSKFKWVVFELFNFRVH